MKIKIKAEHSTSACHRPVAVTLSSSRWTAARSALRHHPIPPLSLPLKRWAPTFLSRVSNFDRGTALPACLSLKLSWPNDKYQCLAGFVVFGYWCNSSAPSPHLCGRNNFIWLEFTCLGILWAQPRRHPEIFFLEPQLNLFEFHWTAKLFFFPCDNNKIIWNSSQHLKWSEATPLNIQWPSFC